MKAAVGTVTICRIARNCRRKSSLILPGQRGGVATIGVMGWAAWFVCSRSKALEGQRTPRRFARFGCRGGRASVLECGGPPPLFPGNAKIPGFTLI